MFGLKQESHDGAKSNVLMDKFQTFIVHEKSKEVYERQKTLEVKSESFKMWHENNLIHAHSASSHVFSTCYQKTTLIDKAIETDHSELGVQDR